MSTCNLTINNLRLWVTLGCGAEEKGQLQLVDISVILNTKGPPPGCHTDLLTDVYCYKDIIERIELAVADRPFNLVEQLTMTVWGAVRLYLDEAEIEQCAAELEVVVTKCHPPIANVHGGISFSYRE